MAVTNAGSGVDYGAMDPFKQMAQKAAGSTDEWAARLGFKVVEWSRGESVFLIDTGSGYLGLVVEGLGTKALVADAFRTALDVERVTGQMFHYYVAICNVAMALNDLITLGVSPLAYSQYLAVGDSSWFDDSRRCDEIVRGTRDACIAGRCVWGGGETPTLRGVIVPGTVDLAGSAMGIIVDKTKLINPANIEPGDVIVIVESSGIHANGLSMARNIAAKLPKGYLTELPDGKTFGETLLSPTHLYVDLVEDCLAAGVPIHYAVNITGHGWRKLMRAVQPFTYVIEKLPTRLPIFDFMQERGPITNVEAWGSLNMGGGFALYVPRCWATFVINKAADLGKRAYLAGHIIEDGKKRVVMEPLGFEFNADSLAIR